MAARENRQSLRTRYALLSAGALFMATQAAMATTFTWTNGDANALWDTVSNDWTTGSGNTPFVSDNAAPNGALFTSANATPGTVTVTGTTSTTPILTSGITFNEAGWTVAGGFLSGATSTADGSIAITNSGNNTISTSFVNNGSFKTSLNITGAGLLTLSGTSTNTGGTTITGTGGNTKVLLTSTSGINASNNNLTLDGGTVVGAISYPNNNIKIGPGGGYIDTNNGTVNINGAVTISDVTPGTGGGLNFVSLVNATQNGGLFNWNGAATFSGGLTINVGTVNISGAKNYTGNTTLAGPNAQIRLGGNDVVPTGTTVVISASNQGFQLRGFNQTVAGIDSNGVVNNNRFIGQANGSGMGGTTGSTLTVTGTSTFGGQIRDGTTNNIGGGFTALRKTTGGVLTLNNGSLFTGGTTIDGGTIQLGHSRALAGPGAVNQQSIYAAGQNPGVVNVNSGGTLDLGGQAIYAPVKLNGGTLGNSSATASAVNNGVFAVAYTGPGTNLQAIAGATVTGGGGTGTVVNPWFGFTTASLSLTNGGTGYTSAPTVSISGTAGGYILKAAGTTTINGSGQVDSITITSPGLYGAMPTTAQVTFTGGGGSGTTVSFNDGTFTLLGMAVTDPGTGYTAPPTITLQGAATMTPVMSGVTLMSDSSIGGDNGDISLNYLVDGAGGLTKIGADVVRLNGANTYAGNTNINNGTLLINASHASPTINLNGGTLGGTGTVNAVVAGANPHTIAPSATLATGTVATLTATSLTTNANTTLAFQLVTPNAPGGSDTINVTGASALNLGAGTKVAITGSGVGQGSLGYYKAIQYNGPFTGSYTSSAITMPAESAGKILYTMDIAHDAGFIDIHRGFQGDANDDGVVNFADFVRISNNYGLADKGWFGGDLNGDGTTNFADFVMLSNNYGNTVGGSAIVVSPEEWKALADFSASAAGVVPEPASLALLGVGAAALLARRRRK